MKACVSVLLSGVLLVATCHLHAMEKFYRYKDAQGLTVIDTFIPPERVEFGYEILNEAGRVIETVERKRTAEEIVQYNAEKEAEKKKAIQREYDISLLTRYSFVTDIEAEKERKIREMNVRATILKGNLNSVRAELEVEYDRAAKAERAGRPVSQKIKDRIEALEAKITTTEELLNKRKVAIQQTRLEYLRAIERFKELKAFRGR